MIRIDESERPLVTFTFEGSWSDDEFEDYLASLKAAFEKGERIVNILDARRATSVPSAQRRAMAAWLRDNASLLSRYLVGTAFVIDSAIIRGVLTAILWLQPVQGPHIVVPTLTLARVWARERLAEDVRSPAA